MPWHGIARAPDKLLPSPAYPVRTAWYAAQVPALPLPTCAPLAVESAVPLIKHQPRMSSLPTIIYLISAGATGMMM